MYRSEKNKYNRKKSVSYPMETLTDDVHGRSSLPSNAQNVKTYERQNTRLLESIPSGDVEYMTQLLKDGANANATCCLNHVSGCHIAASHNNGALALLLSSGADRNRSDKHGRTPLHLAAWAGNAKQINLLLNWEDWKSVADCNKQLNEFMNKQIHPNEVSTLVDGQGDITVDHTHLNIMDAMPLFQEGWTALHAASARARHRCVQSLLDAGADPNVQDHLHRTPLDVAGCAHYEGHKINVNNFMKTIDLLLNNGGEFLKNRDNVTCLDTPLHTAVELGSVAAVKHLMQAGLSATVWNSRGLTAMHVCVEKRNKELLQLLARQSVVDWKDQSESTVLCASVKAKWAEGVSIVIDAGATNMKVNARSPIHYIAAQLEIVGKLQETNPPTHERSLETHKQFLSIASNMLAYTHNTNVINLAAALGAKEVLEKLLNYIELSNRLNEFDCFGPPVYYALLYNRIDCAKLLICKGARINLMKYFNIVCNDDTEKKTSLLHIAAIKNHYEIAEMIIQKDPTTVHAVVNGRLPLDEACYNGHKEMISLLLRNKADLSGSANRRTIHFPKQSELLPIENLMNNLAKPTEFLEHIFDSYITSKGKKFDDSDVEVDFRVLMPNPEKSQMSVIQSLIDTGNRYDQQKLLLHPLVESFLYLKWRSVSVWFYGLLILHIVSVLAFTVFVQVSFWYKDTKTGNESLKIWCFFIYLSLGFPTLLEALIIKLNKSKRYILCFELLVTCLFTLLAFSLPFFTSWDSKPDAEFVRFLWSVAVLLACVRIMFLVSRVPNYGYYILMYGKVATKVFKVLFSFFLLIFGFAVSFMIQFHTRPPFENIGTSALTTLVMMTSEIGYIDTMNAKSVEQASASLMWIRITFVTFLIFVSIVLMNLLVGVAVNDVNNLEVLGNIKSLVKQVGYISAFESINIKKFESSIVLRPRRASLANRERLPTRLIDAIFDKAQLQRRVTDEEQHSTRYDMKLDEIHKVIVHKNDVETKSKNLYNMLNKIIKDNNKIHGDIAVIKDFVAKNNREGS